MKTRNKHSEKRWMRPSGLRKEAWRRNGKSNRAGKSFGNFLCRDLRGDGIPSVTFISADRVLGLSNFIGNPSHFNGDRLVERTMICMSKSVNFPRIVTNGYRYRIELSDGDFYRECPSGMIAILGPLIVSWRTFFFARRRLQQLVRGKLMTDSQWIPVTGK